MIIMACKNLLTKAFFLCFEITKKLTGWAKGTALWQTSVSNEIGQVLMSVLTAKEGPGIDLMTAGLVARYKTAAVPDPVVLYVDCGCCNDSMLRERFAGWPALMIRLDIWHSMRRMGAGCTTGNMSQCFVYA